MLMEEEDDIERSGVQLRLLGRPLERSDLLAGIERQGLGEDGKEGFAEGTTHMN